MADIYCPKPGCGEPIDIAEFHDIADEQDSTFDKVLKAFRKDGCKAIGSRCNTGGDAVVRGLPASAASEALFDIMGDDPDGMAAMMEDHGF